MNSKILKLISSLLVLMALLTACSDEYAAESYEGIGSADMLLDSLGKKDWKARHAAMKRDYIANLFRSYGVGYGYNALGEYANYNYVRDRVIDLDALRKYDESHHCNTIYDDRAPAAFQHILEGRDSETLLKELSKNAGLSADLGFFQAEVKSKYATSDLKNYAFCFSMIQDGVTLASRHLEPYDLIEIAKNDSNVLSLGFRRYVAEAKKWLDKGNTDAARLVLEDMFETYGTHLIYHAELGGMLTFTTTAERCAINSKRSLNESSKHDFFGIIGGDEHKEQDEFSFKETAEQRKSRLSVRGGDVDLCTKILYIDTEVDSARYALVDQWYKSVAIDFNKPESSNVELVGTKLIPIADLIFDNAVKRLYNQIMNKAVEIENAAFPRVYAKRFVRIPTTELMLASECMPHIVVSDNEIIGEMDFETIKGRRYIVFYPTIAGEVRDEGVGRCLETDSLYTITWTYTADVQKTQVGISPLNSFAKLPYIYYTNGDVDVAPEDSVEYKEVFEKNPLTLSMWTDKCTSSYKCGPFYLLQGCYSTTSLIGANNYVAISQDTPFGYEIVSSTELEQMMPIIADITGKTDMPEFFHQQWVVPTIKGAADPKVKVFDMKGLNSININAPLPNESSSNWGFILCKRGKNFLYP